MRQAVDRENGHMSDSEPQAYQNLFLQRLRALHGKDLDERTNWVTAASGPLQRPTYTSIFYFDGVEMGRGSGPTRNAAKESTAARALARLPCPPIDKELSKGNLGRFVRSGASRTAKRQEVDDVQATNQPSSSSSSKPPRIRAGLLADIASARLARRAAEIEERRRLSGENKQLKVPLCTRTS